MTDTATQFIAHAMTEFGVLNGSAVKHSVGAKHLKNHESTPFIWWRFGSISHAPATMVGSNDGSIADELQELIVRIWHDDEEQCRIAKNQLLRACRNVGYGPNLEFGSFDWLTEESPGYSLKGAMLEGTITVRFPVKVTAKPTATVTTTTHSLKFQNPVDGSEEEIC